MTINNINLPCGIVLLRDFWVLVRAQQGGPYYDPHNIMINDHQMPLQEDHILQTIDPKKLKSKMNINYHHIHQISSPMSSIAQNRITHELSEFVAKNNPNITITKSYSNTEFKGTIKGPANTPYEGGIFKLQITIPNQYPFKPPKVTFITPVYHPNIDNKGNICIDILKEQWSPSLSIYKVMVSVYSLLSEPNCDDPLDPDAARLFKDDRLAFDGKAREYTKQHAV